MSWLRALVAWLLRLGLVAVCLWYVLRGLDWSAVGRALGTYSWVRILVVLVVSLGAYSLVGYRLHLLSDRRLGTANGVMAGFISLGVNNIFPARLGELAKALFVKRRRQWPFGAALALVFWERFLDVNFLLLLAVVAVAWLGIEIALWPLVAGLLILWSVVAVLRRWPEVGARVAGWVPARGPSALIGDLAEKVGEGLRPRIFGSAVLCSVVIWASYTVFAWAALVWVAGLPLGPGETLAVFVLSAMGIAVPSSPGALGVFEAAVVVSLGWFGVAKSEALPIALVFHLLQLVPSTILGLLFLSVADIGFADLWAQRRRLRAEEAAAANPAAGDRP